MFGCSLTKEAQLPDDWMVCSFSNEQFGGDRKICGVFGEVSLINTCLSNGAEMKEVGEFREVAKVVSAVLAGFVDGRTPSLLPTAEDARTLEGLVRSGEVPGNELAGW